MSAITDLSHRCLVLTADDSLWWKHFRPGVAIACLDGDNLQPVRGNPADVEGMSAPALLDLLEYGALVMADLVGMDPDVFSLVSWYARARPESVLLVRHGDQPLPFEVDGFAVRSLDVNQAGKLVRGACADWAVIASKRRRFAEPEGALLTTFRGNPELQRRRTQNGVQAALHRAAEALLSGSAAEAGEAMIAALSAESGAPDLLIRSALLQRRAGRWHDARFALERAAAVAPTYAPVWRELGIVQGQLGLPDAQEALRRAVDLGDDFEALVTLAFLLARSGKGREADQLFDQAMRRADGQLGLILPALLGRARAQGRINVNRFEEDRLAQLLGIRQAQAAQDPPADPPWSFFDAARASVLLGATAKAERFVAASVPHITAWWQRQTFEKSIEAFEAAGIDGASMRTVLELPERRAPVEETSDTSESGIRTPTPPFEAALRSPAWYVENVPCMAACPVGTDAGSYVHLLSQGRFEEAYHVARGPNPFASVCGRVCAAPCEDACRRGNIDEPVEIRSLKRFLTERHGVESDDPRTAQVLEGAAAPCIEGHAYVSHLEKLGRAAVARKVAVIGAGPAGLACAHDLALLGHQVTVFEASASPGGMMRQGIPVYRLPREVIDREVQVIRDLGVEVRFGTPLTAERTLASLLEGPFDAAFLGTGAGKARGLEVEGAELDGVVRAIDFLLNVNQGYRMNLGQRVVVVGGGNVALDVARSARLGRPPDPVWRRESKRAVEETFGPAMASGGRALQEGFKGRPREVHVLARQPMGAWPAQRTVRGAEELEQAQKEGIAFHPLRGLRRIVGENGRVTGVELAEVVQLYDADGRYAPVYGAHAAEQIPCEDVLLAVGQTPDLDYLGTEIKRTKRGLIEVEAETLATSMPGVYAGGDAAFGPRTLIEGVSDGKRAARHLHRWLAGSRDLAMTYTFRDVHPGGVPTAPGYDRISRSAPPTLGLDRRTGIAEVDLNYAEAEAVRQASRCLVCHVQTIYDGDLCIACGRCTDICPNTCLSFVAPDAVAGESGGTLDLAAVEPDTVFMLKDEDQCIRCGLCAERCPTGAMTMEQLEVTVEAT